MSLEPAKPDPTIIDAGHDEGSIEARKQLTRRSARLIRKSLPEDERTTKSLAICAHIEASSAWANANLVLTYFPAGSEVDISRLTDVPGVKTLGAPIVEGEIMRFGCVRRGVGGAPQTIAGPFGLREPDGPPVMLGDVGLVLVPLLAFDSKGNRLGSGKGFYDRFFAANPVLAKDAVLVGVAFEAQRCEELPVETHDYQLDAVATEAGIITFS
jgi:5-formyltetrahydrofolate cyclo-ligase